ncbi:MAG: nucleoside deaminase [Proteobacteria bacterium]|nr:nucleoside deaminase [Pseudomonadota bacterium]
MRRAIALAEAGERADGAAPIGAVLVSDGTVIGEGHNRVGELCDPSAHAEIVAMRAAGQRTRQPRFAGATLYSTLQPCGMCTMASIWAGVRRIVYGAERNQVHQMYFEDRHFETMDFIRDAFRDDMQVTGGVLAADCAALYYGPGDDPPREAQANLPPDRSGGPTE